MLVQVLGAGAMWYWGPGVQYLSASCSGVPLHTMDTASTSVHENTSHSSSKPARVALLGGASAAQYGSTDSKPPVAWAAALWSSKRTSYMRGQNRVSHDYMFTCRGLHVHM